MKRTPIKRHTPLTASWRRLNVVGHSDTAVIKQNIQALVREIVIIRDGGCILRVIPSHHCNGFANDGHLILQADHLLSRSHAATFADTRLIVCVCKGAHGWKSVGSNLNKAQYDVLVKTLISPERVKLWEACEKDSWRPVKTGIYDWKVAEVALTAELAVLKSSH